MIEKEKATTKKKVVKKIAKKTVPVKKAVPVKKKAPSVKKVSAVKKKASVKKVPISTSTYSEGVGRRKTAVARVRIFSKLKNEFIVNEKNYSEYFTTYQTRHAVISPLILMNMEDKFKITAKVKGSGPHSQAEAVRHGLSRALVKFNPEFRKRLKKAGYLTRDPRMRERKKFGKKRARKSPQWSKR